MEPTLHYSIRDILITPGRALSAKRIFVMSVFLCAALIVYDLFTYAALAVGGYSLSLYWSVYGLLPLFWFHTSSMVVMLFYWLGVAVAILVLMTGFFAVAAIEIEHIRGNRFFSAFDAIKFGVRRFSQLFISEISVLAFIGIIVLLILLLGVIVRIPIIGEWVFVLTFVLPGFIVAIFTVFIIFVLVVSIILLPAVAAAERHGEAFTAILETFSTVIRQPIRWVVYTVYAFIAAKIFSFVYAYFSFRAVQFFTWCTSITAGEKAEQLVRSGLSHLPVKSSVAKEMFTIFPGIDWSFSITAWSHGGTNDTAGYGMTVMLFLIFVSIIGYALAVIATAQARGYVVIRFLKDDYKITEETSLFFTEEHVNEPVTNNNPDTDNQQ